MEKHKVALESLDPYRIRNDFPIFERKIRGKPLIYFDNAATSQKPKSVIEVEKRFYEETNANIHRALHNLRKGDEVLITIMEHHSNIVPWQMLRDQKGITLKILDVDDEGRLKLDELPRLISERTKLVSVIHASNVLGTVNPVRHVINEAKKVGALVLVDAAQSIPHIPVNVTELGCDFLVASGHKMLGPTGTGFLYGRYEILNEMEPFLYGGDMIETVTIEKSTWNELPWKYEAGTPNI